MIKQYFTDRDCYTMVRPTEEEKDLQVLNPVTIIESANSSGQFIETRILEANADP